MTKLTLTEQEELFAKDCKLINLRYEYTNYTGKEKWAVVTELTEKKLRKKYPDIIKRYTPFVLLSMAQGEVINESDRNDDKYEKRAKRTLDVYGYEDDISEQFHRELITPFADPFEQAEEEQLETVDDEQLIRRINTMLKKTFGLWIYKKEKEENIRCLCPKCLSEYIDNPNYIVRRLNPFAKEKDRCDKCDKAGWDYIVTERNSVRKGKSGSYEK